MRRSIIFFVLLLTVINLEARIRRLTAKEKAVLRQKLVATALSYKGRKGIDCSGFIRKVMLRNNITIFEKQSIRRRGDNGVKIIFNTLRKYHKIFRSYKKVKPGDLIFFDNTYDKNHNRLYDDRLTHIGMVLSVDKAGTIKFIHSTGKGIIISFLNIRYRHKYRDRNGKVINSFLRRKSRRDSHRVKYLAGELVSYFGTIF